ncbi:unnamed protein product [Protopolystoma xenopodis]|uniref:Uncharacterized protein n=1 Tax=Protopolystoma xenopodis TaxID=117903 RepID=A0A3S5AM19_9PLAT|nr:unnamed protein product [Protopolystoma xenopodis]
MVSPTDGPGSGGWLTSGVERCGVGEEDGGVDVSCISSSFVSSSSPASSPSCEQEAAIANKTVNVTLATAVGGARTGCFVLDRGTNRLGNQRGPTKIAQKKDTAHISDSRSLEWVDQKATAM